MLFQRDWFEKNLCGRPTTVAFIYDVAHAVLINCELVAAKYFEKTSSSEREVCFVRLAQQKYTQISHARNSRHSSILAHLVTRFPCGADLSVPFPVLVSGTSHHSPDHQASRSSLIPLVPPSLQSRHYITILVHLGNTHHVPTFHTDPAATIASRQRPLLNLPAPPTRFLLPFQPKMRPPRVSKYLISGLLHGPDRSSDHPGVGPSLPLFTVPFLLQSFPVPHVFSECTQFSPIITFVISLVQVNSQSLVRFDKVM